MTVENIKNAIINLFNFPVINETDESITFNIISDKNAILIKSEVEIIIDKISNFSTENDVELISNTSYEVLVKKK